MFIGGCVCCAASFVGARAAATSQTLDAIPLTVAQIAEGVWRHTSWKPLADGTPFPSNGLVIQGEREGLIIDTTWPLGDMSDLMRIASSAVGEGRPLRIAVTHAHDDRMSGLAIARDHARDRGPTF